MIFAAVSVYGKTKEFMKGCNLCRDIKNIFPEFLLIVHFWL